MTDEDEQVTAEDGVSYCRHCGAEKHVATYDSPITGLTTVLESGDDWLCAECERWQDQMICPTCHQLARVSLMPEEAHPQPAKPMRASRSRKES